MTARSGSVLVVDDDRVNRIMLSKLLANEGYRPTTAVDGEEALKAVTEEAFDAILLDIMMPGIDGIEVLQSLKCDSRLWHIPVVMVSAVEETESIVRCIELGAEDYLLKPFDPVLLRARVNACLARKRFHDLEVEYHNIVKEQAAELEELNRQLTRRVWRQVEELDRVNRLRRFLPSELAERIVSSEEAVPLEAHRQRIAVLACALDGLSAFAERGEPQPVFEILNGFHTTVEALVSRFEATLGSGPSDGITVFFNDPLPCPDPAARAAGMGAALAEEMPVLLGGWRERHGCQLSWGAGISLGDATLGRVGVEDRWNYTAIGPVVDEATRLCDQARQEGAVLLSPEVRAAVGSTEEMIAGGDVGG